MSIRGMWKIYLLIGTLATATVLSTTVLRLSRYNGSLLLPSYHSTALDRGISGTIAFDVTFDNGKVKRVGLKASKLTLRSGAAAAQSDTDLLLRSLSRTVGQWRSSVVSPFSEVVSVELKTDARFPIRGRSYEVEYGEHDVIKKITITGPALQE